MKSSWTRRRRSLRKRIEEQKSTRDVLNVMFKLEGKILMTKMVRLIQDVVTEVEFDGNLLNRALRDLLVNQFFLK